MFADFQPIGRDYCARINQIRKVYRMQPIIPPMPQKTYRETNASYERRVYMEQAAMMKRERWKARRRKLLSFLTP